MGKLVLFVVAVAASVAFTSCEYTKMQSKEKSTIEKSAQKTDVSKVSYVEDVLKNAKKEAGKKIMLKGFVTRICKHTGRRCIVMGNDQKTSIRVEAGGNISRFNNELIGSEVVIKGILKENRFTKEDLDKKEEELKVKLEKENNDGTYDAELNNLNNMRKWMKENNKNYYSEYIVEGIDYEVVE